MYNPIFYCISFVFLLIITFIFNRKLILFVIFLVFILLLTFRNEDVGNDTHTYIAIFNSLSSVTSNYFTENKEFLFIQLNIILSNLGFSYDFLFFICALLSLIPFYLIISKYSDNYAVSISVFCSIGPFLFMHSGMRQGVSIGLFYLVLYLFLNKRYISSFIIFLMSLNFHSSSIVSGVFIVLTRKYNEFFLYVSLFISSLIAFIPSIQMMIFKVLGFLIPSKYIELVEFQFSENITSLGLRNIFLSLMCIVLILSISKVNDKSKLIFINVSIFGILMNNFFGAFDLLSRIVSYFTPALCVSIPISYSFLFKGKSRLYANIITIIIFIFFFIRAISTDNLRVFNV